MEPTKIAVMHESDLRDSLRWHVTAWWIIFILLIASWFGFGALLLNQTGDVRSEARRDSSHMMDRLNEATSFTQSRIDTRASSLDARMDQLLRDNIMLHSELSSLEAKYAAQEGMCRTDCTPGGK